MKIIRYFCIVKRLNNILRTIFLPVLLLAVTLAKGQGTSDSTMLRQVDSISISLLTCSPGQQVWSLYGHTAIRIQDPVHQQDMAINYGMFDFRQKFFIPRFVFGLTDYEMGVEPFQMFLIEYAREGRGVVEQRLNLTAEEKMAILSAVSENYQPQNRVYRYNYFYDNCTTRARDILIQHINGKVEYAVRQVDGNSYREMIHQWNTQHRWARFGNDLLLGIKADFKTEFPQQQFLPDSLRSDFAHATIVGPDGRRRPLVDSTSTVLTVNGANVSKSTDIWDTLTPRLTFGLLALLVVASSLYEWKRRKPFWLLDLTLLTLDGLAGLVLTAMIFSQHPTVRVNLQIFLLNPLSLIFVYPAINQQLKGKLHFYWRVFAGFLVLSLIGAIFQNYAEGMVILALTLMVRCLLNIKTLTPTTKK